MLGSKQVYVSGVSVRHRSVSRVAIKRELVKIETRLINEKFASVMGECDFEPVRKNYVVKLLFCFHFCYF